MSTYVEQHGAPDWTVTDPELSPVRMAIVGAGYWGRNLVRNALQSPATQLTAVCDSDLPRALDGLLVNQRVAIAVNPVVDIVAHRHRA